MAFNRGMGKLVESLKNEDLFQSKLKKDVERGDVYFTLRPGHGSFYHKGGLLFYYKNNGFTTYSKYGFLPDIEEQASFTAEELGRMPSINDFSIGYERIKERTKVYFNFFKPENYGLSALYRFSPASKRSDRYFLVDIEVSFGALEEDDPDSCIDLLLYDNEEQQLLFCEAKLYSNNDLWNNNGEKVLFQLKRYNPLIKANTSDIIEQYTVAFEEFNELFNTALKPPISIYDKCGLLIFDYDDYQWKGKLKPVLEGVRGNYCFHGHPCRPFSDIRSEVVKNLYESLCNYKGVEL